MVENAQNAKIEESDEYKAFLANHNVTLNKLADKNVRDSLTLFTGQECA